MNRPRNRERGLSRATKAALDLVRTRQCTAYAAAKATGIALSTIYRALKRAGFVGVPKR